MASSNNRVLRLNQPNLAFADNRVCNSKYTPWTFLPLNIREQFSRHINRYFLFIAFLQLWNEIAPVHWITTCTAAEQRPQFRSSHRLTRQ